LESTIAWGFFGALALSVLMFGTVEPWSLAVFELLTTGLLALWVIKSVAEKRFTLQVPKLILPLGALLVFGLLQSATGMSMDREATRAACVSILFVLAAAIITGNFFASRERLARFTLALTWFGFALALFAILQHVTWDGHIYWVRPTDRNAFGPFGNRNHYAGLMEMLAPLPLALMATRAARRESWAIYGFVAALMGLSIIVSLSRGGMISFAAGLIFLAVARRREKRRAAAPRKLPRLGVLSIISLAVIAGVIWLGAEGVLNRLIGTIDERETAHLDYYGRDWIWKDTLAMIAAHPVTGVGLGAYGTLYPLYSHADGSMILNYAHNDYLQLLAEAGVIGAALALWFIVGLFREIAAGLRAEDARMRALSLGAGAGCFSIFIHSLFDFNLQIFSNSVLFVVLSIAISQAARASSHSRDAALKAAPAKAGYVTGVTS
jgi:O-antigen ligase